MVTRKREQEIDGRKKWNERGIKEEKSRKKKMERKEEEKSRTKKRE